MKIPPNTMRFKVWTETLRMEYEGSISAGVIQAFCSIMPGKTRTAAENRELALKLMQQHHEELKVKGL